AGFIFNTPRLISAFAPLFAGTLIVGLGGYGKAATIIGLFYGLGLLAVPFLPETKGMPLPEADTLSLPQEPIRKTASPSRRRSDECGMYQDLREFIDLVEKLGALRRIPDADPQFEIGGVTEVAAGLPECPALFIRTDQGVCTRLSDFHKRDDHTAAGGACARHRSEAATARCTQGVDSILSGCGSKRRRSRSLCRRIRIFANGPIGV